MNIDKKYYQEINNNLTNTIQDTNIDAPNKKVGKVRDAYFLDEKVVMISTDRQSAFDRVLAAIPYKGAVLNSVSAWWFKKTKHLFQPPYFYPRSKCFYSRKMYCLSGRVCCERLYHRNNGHLPMDRI